VLFLCRLYIMKFNINEIKELENRKLPKGRPRTRWSDYIFHLAWSGFGVEPVELSEIAVDREIFRVLVLLFPRPSPEEKRA